VRAQITLGAVTLGLLLVGCGHSSSQRPAVAAYLKKVNRVEAKLVTPLSTVTTTGRQFTKIQSEGGSLTSLLYASQAQGLKRAGSRIRTLRGQLADLKAPAPARRLRSLLLQVIDLESKLTVQLEKLVLFLPRFNAALLPIAGATKNLEAVLSRQTAYGPSGVAALYAAKAAALRKFKGVLERVLRRLGRLSPPDVSKPDYKGEIASIQGMSTTAGQLASALVDGPSGDVQHLLVQFDRAATSNQTVAAQKTRIAAVKAYDRLSLKLNDLSQQADRERARLANTLA
jgi:hypothetical protein